MESMRPVEVEAVIRFAQTGLRVLSERLLTLLALVGALGAFAWVMVAPDWIRASSAACYAVLVLWPCIRLESSKQKE